MFILYNFPLVQSISYTQGNRETSPAELHKDRNLRNQGTGKEDKHFNSQVQQGELRSALDAPWSSPPPHPRAVNRAHHHGLQETLELYTFVQVPLGRSVTNILDKLFSC